jgi:hypothetical protein
MQFLGSIAGFANSMGGDLLIGMRAENGLPVAIPGLEDTAVDGEILRIRQVVGTSIEPHVSLDARAIQWAEGRSVVVLRVPRSWNRPHGIEENEHFHFYQRHAAGRAPMTLSELRSSFNFSRTVIEYAKQFRADRVATLTTAAGPWGYLNRSLMVLHIIPFASTMDATRIDVSKVRRFELLSPHKKEGGFVQQGELRYNLDGALMRNTRVPAWHSQLFRDGAIEYASTWFFGPDPESPKYLDPWTLQVNLVNLLPRFFRLQESLGIAPPVTVMLNLLHVGNLHLNVSDHPLQRSVLSDPQIDRDLVVLPDVVTDDFKVSPTTLLKTVFDSLWNAAGEKGCPYYQADADWHIDPSWLDEPDTHQS